MFYVPTSELDSKRLPEVVEGLDTVDVLIERKSQENRINIAPIGKAEEHMAEVAVAMLYFACGGMDESHNIVLPHRGAALCFQLGQNVQKVAPDCSSVFSSRWHTFWGLDTSLI